MNDLEAMETAWENMTPQEKWDAFDFCAEAIIGEPITKIPRPLPLDFSSSPTSTYIEMDYHEVDQFVNEYCELTGDRQYSFCEDIEARNDTKYTIDCSEKALKSAFSNEEWLNHELEEIQEQIEDSGFPNAYSLFQILAYYDIIPKSKYLVTVSW